MFGLMMRAAYDIVSIHAFRGEGDPGAHLLWAALRVSIHAFRGEGDRCAVTRRRAASRVSIHAFRGEGDAITFVIIATGHGFNPRLPGGRRPKAPKLLYTRTVFQSTPSGGKATFVRRVTASGRPGFQSTPSGGKATRLHLEPVRTGLFQSTPSGGKATPGSDSQNLTRPVSIHAFRGEGDPNGQRTIGGADGFNPRLPGGRRPICPRPCWPMRRFQSTPSGGKATHWLDQLVD